MFLTAKLRKDSGSWFSLFLKSVFSCRDSVFCITTDKMVRTTFAITLTDKYYRTMTQEMESRIALKDLVDRYVAESDGNIKSV